MERVIVRQERVMIPTYEPAEYDKNPMFLEKRVYQGSSGRVYPHPVCEGVSDTKTEKEYEAVFLENDYILVMILPQIGGKIHRLYDKTNGYDAVYYNEVIKPALVGLAGPWVSGGIEFNWPQHHRPSTFDPVDYKIEENPDGSATVWVGETEKMFHTKATAGFTVYPDKAYLEIKGRVYNPTERPQTFLWWANPAVAVNDFTQSVFPPDVNAVMDHGKRDVSEFPIAKGVYYKYDYAPGTDISRYKNIPVPTSYMAYHSDFDFIGNYNYGKNAGLLHIADHHVSPGKKQWTWGNGDFGRAWDRNLTDENGPYIELMTGMFTDNQPDFTFLKPYEEKSFVQYFMPYKEAGAVKNASLDAAVNAEKENGRLKITVYSPSGITGAKLTVYDGERSVFETELEIGAACAKTYTADCGGENYKISITKDGKELISVSPVTNTEPIPSSAEAIPEPEELETTEKLFLAAVHLEQYRHATYSPEPYYLEGLRRDSSDIRLNNGYGKYLYNRGYFRECEKYFRAAIKSSTWKNPNPYDCEPYYNLGLSLMAQGDEDKAFDAFYKAAWDGNMQDKAFYKLASISALRGDYEEAAEFADKSLAKGMHNLKARTLKSALQRALGKPEEAADTAEGTKAIDALCHSAYYELFRAGRADFSELERLMRGDAHSYIELALIYAESGFLDDAVYILNAAPEKTPMVYYYLYLYTDDAKMLEAAENADSSYCFPNRLEDIAALEKAAEQGGEYAKYYLGCLFYDKGNRKRAQELWESCNIQLATLKRNLSLVYYNELHDKDRALRAMEEAFAADRSDARVFFELDRLYKSLNFGIDMRLRKMNENADLLEKRDDLYTEYITLLNLNGEYENAYTRIMSHKFHPWEGGEGKIPAQYRAALINMARTADREKATEYLERALTYPENLGEGKLIGNTDSDIYYMLGTLYENKEKSETAYRLAARGEFNLTSAMYYNDQSPQMLYYAAKAAEALGNTAEAELRFREFIKYGEAHYNDYVKIDYFAVSLPDFLVFEGDLNSKNRVHCCLMQALGYLGLNKKAEAETAARRGLAEDCANAELLEVIAQINA